MAFVFGLNSKIWYIITFHVTTGYLCDGEQSLHTVSHCAGSVCYCRLQADNTSRCSEHHLHCSDAVHGAWSHGNSSSSCRNGLPVRLS